MPCWLHVPLAKDAKRVVLQQNRPLYLEKHTYRKVTLCGALIARGRERLGETQPNTVLFLFIEKSRLQAYFSFFSLRVSRSRKFYSHIWRNPDKLACDNSLIPVLYTCGPQCLLAAPASQENTGDVLKSAAWSFNETQVKEGKSFGCKWEVFSPQLNYAGKISTPGGWMYSASFRIIPLFLGKYCSHICKIFLQVKALDILLLCDCTSLR